MNLLSVTLKQILSTNKLLLVLDDVWDATSFDWMYLIDILNITEAKGSRIIITTRNERVALFMHTFFFVHLLRLLESEDCWSIIANIALLAHKQRFGNKFARKCDRLPLVAVTIGNALHTNFSSSYEHRCMLERNIWELANFNEQASLQSSYHYLSATLKQCFAYCSIFSKKSILEKNMVVRLWIAEGLV